MIQDPKKQIMMNKMMKSYLFTIVILYKTHHDKVKMENSWFPIFIALFLL